MLSFNLGRHAASSIFEQLVGGDMDARLPGLALGAAALEDV
jgi:hypothetical protein